MYIRIAVYVIPGKEPPRMPHLLVGPDLGLINMPLICYGSSGTLILNMRTTLQHGRVASDPSFMMQPGMFA